MSPDNLHILENCYIEEKEPLNRHILSETETGEANCIIRGNWTRPGKLQEKEESQKLLSSTKYPNHSLQHRPHHSGWVSLEDHGDAAAFQVPLQH